MGILSDINLAHFLIHLGAQMLDFGSPRRLAGSKIAPKVLQLGPKGFKIPSLGACFYHSKRRLVPSIAIGAFLDLFLVDFGAVLVICSSCWDQSWRHFGKNTYTYFRTLFFSVPGDIAIMDSPDSSIGKNKDEHRDARFSKLF